MRLRDRISATLVVSLATVVGTLAACRSQRAEPLATSDGAAPSAAASASSSAAPFVRVIEDAGPMSSAIPVPESKILDVVNPKHLAPYAGPTGAVEGVVKVSGDQAPKANVTIPFECGEAYGTYGKVFREGLGRTLADAMVAVTGYDAYVPAPPGDAVPVRIHGCAFEQKTLAFMFGKRIEVSNTDARESFIPQLLGAHMPALIVAIPRGDAVKLYPTEVGHYALGDAMNRTWMYADVFVLHYPTTDVTKLDGRYRVTGIPVGKVKVTAYLPAIDAAIHPDVGVAEPTVEREIEIRAGETVHLDLVIPYKAPKAAKKPAAPVPVGPDIR